MNKKYIIGIAVVVLIVGLVVVFSNQGTPQQAQAPSTATNNVDGTPQVAQETGTSNIDDVTATVSADADSDSTPAADSDSSTFSENDQAMSDFGQSLDKSF